MQKMVITSAPLISLGGRTTPAGGWLISSSPEVGVGTVDIAAGLMAVAKEGLVISNISIETEIATGACQDFKTGQHIFWNNILHMHKITLRAYLHKVGEPSIYK